MQGLQVRLWDDDIITSANLGRQRFFECETGLYKSVALVNRINRCIGSNWKAETAKFEKDKFGRLPENARATITITCVDNVQARFGVAEILSDAGMSAVLSTALTRRIVRSDNLEVWD